MPWSSGGARRKRRLSLSFFFFFSALCISSRELVAAETKESLPVAKGPGPVIAELPVTAFMPTQPAPPAVMREPIPGHYVPMKLPQGSGDSGPWNPRPKFLFTEDRLLALPEEKINIGNVALEIAKDAFPQMDAKAMSAELDQIAGEVRRLTPPDASVDYQIRVMNTVFYRHLGIDYDKTDYNGRKLINRYLHGVLQTHRGTCANLATFYIAVGQRLGYPLYAVAAPQHTFVRWVEPNGHYENIEPTGKGGWSTDQDYVDKMQIPQAGIDNGVFMRTLSHREFVAHLLKDHGAYFYGHIKKDYVLAIEIIAKALNNDPLDAEMRSIMGQYQITESHHIAGVNFKEMFYLTGSSFMMEAQKMGIAAPLKDDYWKQPRKTPPQDLTRRPSL